MPSVAKLINWFSPEQAKHIAEGNGGWLPPHPRESIKWSYASATTVTVGTDATEYYNIGDKVRFKQNAGTYVYFVIISVAATTIGLYGGSDYSVANQDITDIEISKSASPLGFPKYFNWSPTLGGFSGNPTNSSYTFQTIGRRCFVDVRQGSVGTSNGTTLTISAPITAATLTNGQWGACAWAWADNSVAGTTAARADISTAASTINCYKDISAAAWTAANGKRISFTLGYPF